MFSLGDEVAWIHTYHIAGHPHTYWRTGIVEAKRGDVIVVRDRYGHLAEVECDRLLIKNTVKPRRAGNSKWRKP